MFLSGLDIFVLIAYAVVLFAIAIYVSREPAGHSKNTEDYFLAGKSLPWWAIGASLVAANISAEQIIGMSGDGYKIGLAIAAYEWQAAIVLIIVAKYFLPIFLKREIYTMPQFLETRYGEGVKTTMSIFWIVLYTVVNLTAVMWLGSLAVNTLTGASLFWGMAGLAAFALAYSMYGGLKAVALTDILQVVILVIGGFIIAWMTMGMIGGDTGVLGGMQAELNLGLMMMKRQRVIGSTLRARSVPAKSAVMDALHERVWPLIESGEIKPIIEAEVALSDAGQAHALIAGNETVGKVILTL